jgi:hypothetical protein
VYGAIRACPDQRTTARVDHRIPDATGSVEINQNPDEDIRGNDKNPANDKAAIVVNPTTVQPAPGGNKPPTAAGLPITGSRATTVGGAAGVLLGAGALLTVVGRRRPR